MKKSFTLMSFPLLMIANQVAAEATLTSLKVKEDIVYFSTGEAKIATSPICMAAENSDKWSLSLNTATGKAIYALLVTASADNRKITVESANDCANEPGFERANSVELAQAGISTSNVNTNEFVPTFFSGSLIVAAGSSGTIITITPPAGHRARINTLGSKGTTYAEGNISVFLGNKNIIQSLTLKSGNSSGAGLFSVAHSAHAYTGAGAIPFIQGGIDETITVVKESGNTNYTIHYSYTFSK